MADKDLTVHLKADDKITPAAKKAAAELKKLEKPVEVEVDADVSGVLQAFDLLTNEAKATAVAAEALGRALGPELAAKSDTTAIVQDLRDAGLTIDQITGNADQLAAKLKEVSDADVGGKLGANLGTARGQIDSMSDSARGANSALANMIGNTTQDLGALGGFAGSAGVAIGQLGEYAADAALGGEKLSSSLLSMAKVAGPMAAIGIATAVVAKEMARAAASKAFNAAQLKAFTKSVEDTGSVLDAINDQLEETGQLVFKIAAGFDAVEVGGDIAPTLAKLNLQTDEFLSLVNSGDASWTRFMNGLKKAGIAEQDLINIQVAHGRILADQANAAEAAALKNELLADGFDDLAEASVRARDAAAGFTHLESTTLGLSTGLNRMGIVGHEALQKIDDESDDAVDAISDVEFAAQSLETQFDRLRGQVDMKETIHNFRVDFLTAIAKVQEGTALTGDEILRLEDDIISVAEFANLNPVQVQSLIDAVEHGDIAGVLTLVQNDLDRNPAQLRVDLVLGRISRDLASIRQAERSVTMTVGAVPTTAGATPSATSRGVSATPTAATVAPAALSPITIRVPAPVIPTINFNVGVMGNRFDSQRAITKALRAHQRLNGVRP